MDNNKQRIAYLLNQYEAGTCSKEELEELFVLIRKGEHESQFEAFLQNAWEESGVEKASGEPEWNKMYASVIGRTTEPIKNNRLWYKIAVAASILLLLYVGKQYLPNKQQHRQEVTQTQTGDIAPGGNKAILTLSNGKQIVLTGTQNGRLAVQGNIAISKTADGKVVYTAAEVTSNSAITYNTMTTPKGGQYCIILPDGSKVVLNAASSLHYPTAFTGKERRVELTGEAYFEVVHKSSSPFRVVTGGQVVEDIGTHFNINAYNDEPEIKTTLLEGSVKVVTGNEQLVLKPGQQSQYHIKSAYHNISLVKDADMEEAIAWKNGLFEFKNASVEQVMSNAARWYDLNVIYEGKKPDLKITGRISRNVNLSGLINILQYEGVKFKIEGKKVTII